MRKYLQSVILVFSVFIFFSSCKTTFYGKYKHKNYDYGEILELKSDSSFILKWGVGLSAGISKGTWIITDKKTISLTTNVDSSSAYKNRFVQLYDTSSKSITISVLSADSIPQSNEDLIIKLKDGTSIFAVTDSLGKAIIPLKTNIKSIETFGNIICKPFSFTPSKNANIIFIFRGYSKTTPYVALNSFSLKARGDKLINKKMNKKYKKVNALNK